MSKHGNQGQRNDGPGTDVTGLTPKDHKASSLKGFPKDPSGQSQSENRGKDGGR